MDTPGKQVVATVALGRSEEVLDALLAEGLHPATATDTPITMPWVGSGAGKVSIVVKADEYDAAKAIVDAVEAPHAVAVDAAAGRLGPRLLVVAVVIVLAAWAIIATIHAVSPPSPL